MDLIKKHYEKVILLGLFCVFIALMFLVQNIINSTKSVEEKDLNIPQRRPDFVNEDQNDFKFQTDKRREETKLQWNFTAVNGNASDFIHVFEMAACPHCAKNSEESGAKNYTMLIPASFFTKEKKCPECQNELVVAKPITEDEMKETVFSAADKDRDGIDDEIEQKFGMDSNDPNDARYDKDGDGFSNIFEIRNGFSPDDAEDHPEYWWRLRLNSISQIKLPVAFMALSVGGNPDDKSKWSLQFNLPDRYGRKDKNGNLIITSRIVDIGGDITIDGRRYRVEDVERRVKTVSHNDDQQDKALTNEGKVDISRVFLTEIGKKSNPDKLVMVINQPAYSSDKRPVLLDTGNPDGKEVILKIGETITLKTTAKDHNGRTRTRKAVTYKLKSVDAENNTITVTQVLDRNDRRKDREKIEAEEIVIPMGGKVPAKETPIKEVEKKMDDGMFDVR